MRTVVIGTRNTEALRVMYGLNESVKKSGINYR
jgi:hypothetical protein